MFFKYVLLSFTRSFLYYHTPFLNNIFLIGSQDWDNLIIFSIKKNRTRDGGWCKGFSSSRFRKKKSSYRSFLSVCIRFVLVLHSHSPLRLSFHLFLYFYMICQWNFIQFILNIFSFSGIISFEFSRSTSYYTKVDNKRKVFLFIYFGGRYCAYDQIHIYSFLSSYVSPQTVSNHNTNT